MVVNQMEILILWMAGNLNKTLLVRSQISLGDISLWVLRVDSRYSSTLYRTSGAR